jgi:hypothetical protein
MSTKSTSDHGKFAFLHIAKTGGTTIGSAINAASRLSDVKLGVYPHNDTLPDLFGIDPRLAVSFAVRDPIDRFVSAFNSRLRNGRPVNDNRWQPREAITYLYFPTVNDLAENLETDDDRMLSAARFALESVAHLRRGYKYHLQSVEFLERNKDRIYFVCDTTTIDEDWQNFLAPLRLDKSRLPNIQTLHVAPKRMSTSLSESGRAKLRRYLADEYEIYDYCKAKLFRLNLPL